MANQPRPTDLNHDQIAEAIDAERAQVAHEIHDSLLPLIFAASAAVGRELEQLDGGNKPDPLRLRQAHSWLQQALATGRQILSLAHPPELAEDSWDTAAQKTLHHLISQASGANAADDLTPGSAPQINWRVEIPPSEFDDSTSTACYRIVVEAVRNAIAHGKATEVNVLAQHEQDDVVITVTDNGSGFDPNTIPSDRFGVRSMRGRARLAGGDLQLTSQPGGPTVVRLRLPAAR